ncbi:hypothetical protein Bca52824_015978 [Brassica carinata]|uniref:Uncharacterized protein n=1 Tax=Brassica carinata TaxID=52824 RepID=A0A8X8B4Y9_BRACI|nr:hypothetical protein Bca52824_015978 [Brassica carinata]
MAHENESSLTFEVEDLKYVSVAEYLVHGWGLDFALRRCVEPAHENIGVVDSQWIIHKVIL